MDYYYESLERDCRSPNDPVSLTILVTYIEMVSNTPSLPLVPSPSSFSPKKLIIDPPFGGFKKGHQTLGGPKNTKKIKLNQFLAAHVGPAGFFSFF